MVDPAAILQARILVVDDLPANVRLLTRMLAGAGYTAVTSTTNPRDVCDLQRGNPCDLIILDLQMPEMDGFQVLAALKQQEPEGFLPVLVVTAQPSHKLRALQAGAKDFVSKPLDLPEVLARVHNLLEVRLLYKELLPLRRAVRREYKWD
jgi:CheY-like chemotaxis protein